MNKRILTQSSKKMVALASVLAIGIMTLFRAEGVYPQSPRIAFDTALVEMGDQPRLAQGVGWLDEEVWDDDTPVNIGTLPGGSALEEEMEYSDRPPLQSSQGVYRSRRELIDALNRLLAPGESKKPGIDNSSPATREEIDFNRFLIQVTENYLMPLGGNGIQITNRQRAMLFGYALARPTGSLERRSKDRRRMDTLKRSLKKFFEESGMGDGYWSIVEAASQGRHDIEVAALLRKARYRHAGKLR